MSDYADCDATELGLRIARREQSPLELAEQAIRAVERVNPGLNAVVHRMYEAARARAQAPLPAGPFAGVPMVVKDFDGYVAGVPFTGSSRFLDGFVPDHDSEIIARLRRAGLVFLAKTNCPELGLLGTTEPEWRGPTHNPWDVSRSPGGSSGGSAALVAARAVPIAHGGDGGGSIRIPSSQCGLVGLKASRARVPVGPDVGEGWGGYVQAGGLTRTVRDMAALYDIVSGPERGDPYAAPALPGPLTAELGRDPGKLRIAIHAGSLFGRETHPEYAATVTRIGRELEALGHHVEIAKPVFDREQLVRSYLTQVATGTSASIQEYARRLGRPLRAERFEPATWFMKQYGDEITGVELVNARSAEQAAGRSTGEFHEKYDVFVCPTVTHPPARLGALALGVLERTGLALLRRVRAGTVVRRAMEALAPEFLELTPNTQLFNQTGQPALSLPLGMTRDGLPIGVQFAAALGREDLLVRLASQLEEALPWSERRPRVCVA